VPLALSVQASRTERVRDTIFVVNSNFSKGSRLCIYCGREKDSALANNNCLRYKTFCLIISCGRPCSRNYHTDHIYQIQFICIDIFVRYHRLVCSDQSGNRSRFDYSFQEWWDQAVDDSSRWSSALLLQHWW
jgi:hypothetical protein